MLFGKVCPLVERLAGLVDDRFGILWDEACLFRESEQMRLAWGFAFTFDHRGLLAARAGGEGEIISRERDQLPASSMRKVKFFA